VPSLRLPSALLQGLIRGWIADARVNDPLKDWPTRLMKERGVLLLHGDQAYLWFLEPASGRVLALDTDDVRQRLEPETSPSAATNAVARAARARPELRELLPRRPGRARTCERCEGTGDVEGWSACACAGLGWVT
jgi:hypothetical protein